MIKFSYSFGVAIGIHIIVLLLSTLQIGHKKKTEFNSRNLIDLQYSARPSTAGAVQVKKTPLKADKSTKRPVMLSNTTSTSTTATVESISGSGISNESGPANFEAAIISYRPPVYPRLAQVRGLQGNVRIRIKVSEEGLPINTSVLKSSGHDILDQAALEAITHWRFHKNGSAYIVEKNIVFELKG